MVVGVTSFQIHLPNSRYIKDKRKVMRRVKPYKKVLREARDKYDDIQARYRDGRYDQGERALLVEGLLRRIEGEIEAPIADESAKSPPVGA